MCSQPHPEQPETFYLTTPIYYVNARPHIGHAYSTIVADVLARRHRLLGHDTFFLTGTDEHGQKIERSAAAAGVPPQQFADQVSRTFSDLWQRMGITNDAFIRTTDPRHKQGVQKLFQTLYDRGHIYLSTYTGQYSIGEEMFVDGPPGTIGPDGRPTETVTEENFFFRLSHFQRPLLDLIESDTLKITPESSRNEVLSFLRGPVSNSVALYENPVALSENPVANPQRSVILSEDAHSTTVSVAVEGPAVATADPSTQPTVPNPPGIAYTASGHPYLPGALKDLSVSRSSFTWGIPVPEAVQQHAGTTQSHVIYVWLDALANYMTAIGYGSEDEADQQHFEKYWPANLHVVGKEITRFHCVYWPAFLLALNPAIAHQVSKGGNTSSPGAPSLAPAKGGDTMESRSPRIETPCTPPNPCAPPSAASSPKAGGSADEQITPTSFDPRWAAQWLPKAVTANGWLLFDNSKMSKSKGNVVRTETILEAFGTLCPPVHVGTSPDASTLEEAALFKGTASAVPSLDSNKAASAAEVRPPTKQEQDLFATDVLRYYLLREIPFGQDGSFSFESMWERYNADLTNGYGNLVRRVTKMIEQYFGGELPRVPVTQPVDKTLFPEWWETPLFGVMPSFGDKALANETAQQASGQMRFVRVPDGRGRVGIALYEDLSVAGGDYFYAQSSTLTIREFLQIQFDPLLKAYNDCFTELTSTTFWLLVSGYVGITDEMLSVTKPWKLQDGDPRRLDILNAAAEAIRILSALLYPLIPYSTGKVWSQLGQKDISEALKYRLEWGGLSDGLKLGPLSPIFPRADKSLITLMEDMEAAANPPKPTEKAPAMLIAEPTPDTSQQPADPQTHPAEPLKSNQPDPRITEPSTTDPAAPPRTSSFAPPNPGAQVAASHALTTEREGTPPHTEAQTSGIFAAQPTPDTPQIAIDDFTKIDLRVAKILVAERIPKADKLLRLEVDLGYEQRQILSGIAEHYTPEELIGRKIVIIANLAPRKMRGLESRGMLLAASEGESGKPILATFADDIAVGTRLR